MIYAPTHTFVTIALMICPKSHVCCFALFAFDDNLWCHMGQGAVVIAADVSCLTVHLDREAKIGNLMVSEGFRV